MKLAISMLPLMVEVLITMIGPPINSLTSSIKRAMPTACPTIKCYRLSWIARVVCGLAIGVGDLIIMTEKLKDLNTIDITPTTLKASEMIMYFIFWKIAQRIFGLQPTATEFVNTTENGMNLKHTLTMMPTQSHWLATLRFTCFKIMTENFG